MTDDREGNQGRAVTDGVLLLKKEEKSKSVTQNTPLALPSKRASSHLGSPSLEHGALEHAFFLTASLRKYECSGQAKPVRMNGPSGKVPHTKPRRPCDAGWLGSLPNGAQFPAVKDFVITPSCRRRVRDLRDGGRVARGSRGPRVLALSLRSRALLLLTDPPLRDQPPPDGRPLYRSPRPPGT